LARGRLRLKLPDLRRALKGRFRPHHAYLIEQILAKIDSLDETVDGVTTEIDRRLSRFEPTLATLDTIPVIERIGAISIVAETGGDMSRFPSAAHLCSWSAMCPSQNESAGKRRSGKTVRATATYVALWSKPAWQEGGHRGGSPHSRNRALRHARWPPYDELGADYFDKRHAERAARRHVRDLEALGFHVTIEKAA